MYNIHNNFIFSLFIKMEENFPVDVLWAIKSMFLRSIWNPNALKYTINQLLDAYKAVIIMILTVVILRFVVKFIFKLIKRVVENKRNKEKLLTKRDIKVTFLAEKPTLKILKYPIIWSILVWTCRLQVSLLFWLSNMYDWENNIVREILPPQENWVLWVRSLYSLFIFIIAWSFIWLSFGNKTLRNIWIIIYALWVLFILFAHFLNNWAITNDLTNFTI